MYSMVMRSTVTYKDPSIYKFIVWSSDLIPPLVAAGVAKPWPSRALKHDNSAVYSCTIYALHVSVPKKGNLVIFILPMILHSRGERG